MSRIPTFGIEKIKEKEVEQLEHQLQQLELSFTRYRREENKQKKVTGNKTDTGNER